jgi:hypothetical protein
MNARMMAEQQERYREYVAEQQRRQQNPFHGTIFETMFERGGRGGRAGKRVNLDSQDIIDISYDKIYESD